MKEVFATVSGSLVTDHAFVPKGEWYTLCKECNLSEAAHSETTTPHRARRGELPVTNDAALPRWSGELCDNCAFEMVRTGNCLTCPSCGNNTGCS